MRRYVGSALWLWGSVSVVTLVAGVALSIMAPHFIHNLPNPMVTTVQITCLILVVRLVIATGSRIFLSVLQGMNLMHKATMGNSMIEVIRAILLVGAAYLGYGISGLAVALAVVAMVSVLYYRRLVLKWVSWFGVASPHRSDMREFSSFGGWMLFWNIVTQVLFMSDVVLLGWARGAEAVTVLTFSEYAPFFGIKIMVLVAAGITPGFGKLIGSGSIKRAGEVRDELIGLVWIVTTVVGASILLWNRVFVSAWVGEVNYGGGLVNLLLVVVFLQASFIRIDGMLIDTFLDVRQKVMVGAMAALVSVGLALAFARSFGIVGLLGGLIAGRAILSIAYPLILNKLLRTVGRFHVGTVVRMAIVTSIVFAGAAWVEMQMADSESWHVAVLALVVTIVAGPLSFYLGLDAELRKKLLLRVYNSSLYRRFKQ